MSPAPPKLASITHCSAVQSRGSSAHTPTAPSRCPAARQHGSVELCRDSGAPGLVLL